MDEPPLDFIDPTGAVMYFGVHENKLITEVPHVYLLWCIAEKIEGKVRTPNHIRVTAQACKVARSEIFRRCVNHSVEFNIMGKAIDAASTVFVSIYEADRQNPGQGLHTWLKAKVREALKHIKDEDDNVKEIRANVYSVKMMAGFWLIDLSGYTPALVEVSQSGH